MLLSWSSGKDGAWALQRLRTLGVPVAGLLTTLNEAFDRVAMHGVRRELLEAQAEAAGLPLQVVPLPWPCSNQQYEERMQGALARAAGEGVRHVAFGDLFLDDVRRYREERLAGTGITPLFPLWCGEQGTAALAREMVAGGLSAVLACVDPRSLEPAFLGRRFDAALLADLPPRVDPCGERGEFHSFATDGPMFRRSVPVKLGDRVERDGFWFVELLPA